MTTERTPLFRTPVDSSASAGPSYVHTGSRSRHRQIKQLQCCICAAFMSVFILALVITITYSVIHEKNDNASDKINNDLRKTTTIQSSTPEAIELGNGTDFSVLLLVSWPLVDEAKDKWLLPQLTDDEIKSAIDNATKALGDKELFEENMATPAVNSPSFKHQRAVSTTNEARIVARRGFVENHATREVAQKHDKYYRDRKLQSRKNVGSGPSIKFNTNSNSSVQCDLKAKYRTSNGTCNNKNYPDTYGVAMNPFRRSLNPDYSDGVLAPRKGRDNNDLPSARQISIEVHRPSYETDPHFSVMLAVWGQFLDHDITATAGNQGENGKPIECCDTNPPLHPECFPVILEKGDPYFDKYNVTCMNFIRSAPAPTGKFGPREQLNQASSFIDGSVVYGSSDNRIRSLRTGENGLLRMFVTPDNRTLLPLSTDPNDGCNEEEMNKKGHYCFESGDTRSNENLHLTSMHLIWARHHNYLAQNLAAINPSWDDEKLFQESRKILGAQMQHITYNEFLPILLGEQLSEIIGLAPTSQAQFGDGDFYDETVNPSVANHFAAAAFRFAHTLIPGLMRITKNIYSPDGIALHKMLFNPYSLYEEKTLDDSIEGAISQPLAKSDQYFTNELSEHLFENPKPAPGHLCGLDLVSLNIQRGRDHGLPGYNEWRKHCFLPSVETWDKLEKVIDAQSFATMRAIFNSTEDIDVYSGALSEPPIPGAITGPLLGCLISDQFLRLKVGDSFWYERLHGPQRFTPAQLQQIYGTTLSTIICQNSDNVQESQKLLMRVVTDANPVLNCTELNTFNFTAWEENNKNSSLKMVKINSDQATVVGIHAKQEENLKTKNDLL